jgi:hypothetical protein
MNENDLVIEKNSFNYISPEITNEPEINNNVEMNNENNFTGIGRNIYIQTSLVLMDIKYL